ncbi:MAG TPA: cupin domain-containing protein [Luteitalea sp.]|nr:cupin domain-containing protein [Luteitalea sp.]
MRVRFTFLIVAAMTSTLFAQTGGAPAQVPSPSQPKAASASKPRSFVSASGVRLKVLTDGTDVRGNEVEIVELVFPANSDSGDHRHAVTETFYVLEGLMEQVINGTPVRLTPGMSASIRSTDQVRHKSGPAGAKVLVVWAPGGEIARVTANWKPE